MDPIQARIQNNLPVATFKPISPKPVATIQRPKVTITENPSSFYIEMAILCILSVLPVLVSAFMIRLFAGNIDMLHEYYNLPASQCHIAKSPSDNYTITPLVFNSTLLYWPAQLHLTATVHTLATEPNEHLIISPVRYTFPTPMELEFRCPGGSPYRDKGPGRCDYMVGDAIGKYHELQRLDTFPCYIKDGQIVGTDYDFDNYLIPAYNTVYWCTVFINTVLTMIAMAFTYIIYIASPMQQLLRGSS
jgi:hypothetical protein